MFGIPVPWEAEAEDCKFKYTLSKFKQFRDSVSKQKNETQAVIAVQHKELLGPTKL